MRAYLISLASVCWDICFHSIPYDELHEPSMNVLQQVKPMPGKAQNDQPISSKHVSYEQRRQHVQAMLQENAGTMPQRHLDALRLSLVLHQIQDSKDTVHLPLLLLPTHAKWQVKQRAMDCQSLRTLQVTSRELEGWMSLSGTWWHLSTLCLMSTPHLHAQACLQSSCSWESTVVSKVKAEVASVLAQSSRDWCSGLCKLIFPSESLSQRVLPPFSKSWLHAWLQVLQHWQA